MCNDMGWRFSKTAPSRDSTNDVNSTKTSRLTQACSQVSTTHNKSNTAPFRLWRSVSFIQAFSFVFLVGVTISSLYLFWPPELVHVLEIFFPSMVPGQGFTYFPNPGPRSFLLCHCCVTVCNPFSAMTSNCFSTGSLISALVHYPLEFPFIQTETSSSTHVARNPWKPSAKSIVTTLSIFIWFFASVKFTKFFFAFSFELFCHEDSLSWTTLPASWKALVISAHMLAFALCWRAVLEGLYFLVSFSFLQSLELQSTSQICLFQPWFFLVIPWFNKITFSFRHLFPHNRSRGWWWLLLVLHVLSPNNGDDAIATLVSFVVKNKLRVIIIASVAILKFGIRCFSSVFSVPPTKVERITQPHQRRRRSSTTQMAEVVPPLYLTWIYSTKNDFMCYIIELSTCQKKKKRNGRTTQREMEEMQHHSKGEEERGALANRRERREGNTTQLEKAAPHQRRVGRQHHPKQHNQKERGEKAAPLGGGKRTTALH